VWEGVSGQTEEYHRFVLWRGMGGVGVPLRLMLYSCLTWVLVYENEGCIGQKKESSSVLPRREDLSMRSFELTDPARRWSCRNWQRWRYGQKPVATSVLHGRRYTCVLPL